MTLCNTGPLVALVDRGDPHHLECVAALSRLPPQALITTWCCLTEAMHLLDRSGGSRAQEALWRYVAKGRLILHLPTANEWQRVRDLTLQYHDSPMDLADASLVAAAEQLNLRRIFTLDQHFYAYRIGGQHPFEIVP